MIVVGVMMFLIPRISGLRWLPGDIVIRRKNFTFVFPIATMIVLSVVLTIVLNLLSRFLRK